MSSSLEPAAVAYYRKVLIVHADDLITLACSICQVSRCPDWRNAYDRLSAAGALMVAPERWQVIAQTDRRDAGAPHASALAVGQVLFLEEPDYLPGVGPLHLRVTAVGGIERHADGRWLNVRGGALRPDGSPDNARERYILVRLEALHRRPAREGRVHEME